MTPSEYNMLDALRADGRVHIYSETERQVLFRLAHAGYLHDVYELSGSDFSGYLTHLGLTALRGHSGQGTTD